MTEEYLNNLKSYLLHYFREGQSLHSVLCPSIQRVRKLVLDHNLKTQEPLLFWSVLVTRGADTGYSLETVGPVIQRFASSSATTVNAQLDQWESYLRRKAHTNLHCH